MKITVTFDCETQQEFWWLANRLNPSDVKTVPDTLPMASRPNGEHQVKDDLAAAAREAAAKSEAAAGASTEAPKRGRPPKAKTEAPAQAPAQAQAQAQATDAQGGSGNELQFLKDRITAAARQAMKGEGDKAILGLLPTFREATGLDFVMNATEDHIPALRQLAEQAKVPLA